MFYTVTTVFQIYIGKNSIKDEQKIELENVVNNFRNK